MSDDVLFIRLYIDEDVHSDVGVALRQRGYDVIAVGETKRNGLSDAEQLAFAAEHNRVIFSFNAADYITLHLEYLSQGQIHAGIVVAKQIPIGETVRRLLNLLDSITADEMQNQLRWLSSV